MKHHPIWPVTAVTRDTSPDARLRAPQVGPYGRSVYHCANTHPDDQVATINFPGGAIATLRIGAFTGSNARTLRLLGSHGEISGRLDTGEIEVRRFLPAFGTEVHDWPRWDRDALGRSGMPDDETWTISAGPGTEPDEGSASRESDGHAGESGRAHV